MQAVENPQPNKGRSFDTLAYMKHMESVGFTRAQAEALAEEQNKLIDERLATKLDLKEVESRLEVKIVELGSRLEARIAQTNAETKADIIKWVVGISFAQAAMIVALVKMHM